MNPYYLPAADTFGAARRYALNISGGRTSAYLLRAVLDAHDGALPAHVVPVFTNTGKEREETLEFLHRIEIEWSVPLIWLEFRWRPEASGRAGDYRGTYAVVDYETASRAGEPFEMLISRGMLPNPKMRICTSHLKVRTVERYVHRTLGWPRNQWVNVLGIRSDEPRRVKMALVEECRVMYPLVLAGVTERDITRYWNRSPFDLALRSDQSNCDLCFLKGKRRLVSLIREDPSLAEWWMAQERGVGSSFEKPWSYSDLVRIAESQAPLPLGSVDEGISCFCGD
ncbi:MAG: Nin-like protein [Acidobacteria bacterium]|nr:Nin-like protein [Acidobacteriota bacterium]